MMMREQHYRGSSYPSRGKGSNHEKRKRCMRCDELTLHLYDHGLGYHICTECEL
jgi:hypothetical protein